MGFKSIASLTLLLCLNLFLFSMVSSDTLAPAPLIPPPRECPELGLCLDILGLSERLRPGSRCCSMVGALVEANGTVCICDILRSQVVGIPIGLDLQLKTILDSCDQNQNYICN